MIEASPVPSCSSPEGEPPECFAARAAMLRLRDYLGDRVLGQQRLLERVLIALLADGHLLVEGAPGLAKTRVVRLLGEAIEGDFHRIQFTPDLLPADLTGTEIYRPQEGSFAFHRGPLFHNLVLADEVNRAPAKVQSALLEAMAERQITVGDRSFALPPLFLVLATQNPLEQEGVYPLPEAQLDRFLLHVRVGYPAVPDELAILRLAREEALHEPKPPAAAERVPQELLFRARAEVLGLHVEPALEEYLVRLVSATRDAGAYEPRLGSWIRYGASPRATIHLDRCARAHAWLEGRDYVEPGDVQEMAPDVLRHRLILGFEAEADGVDADRVIAELLARVAVP